MHTFHPNYSNDQVEELIRQYIHNKIDRRLLALRLVDGETFESIAGIMLAEDNISIISASVMKRPLLAINMLQRICVPMVILSAANSPARLSLADLQTPATVCLPLSS